MIKRVIFTIPDVDLIHTDTYCKLMRYDRSELIREALKEFMKNHKSLVLEPIIERHSRSEVTPTLEYILERKTGHCEAVNCRNPEGILVQGIGYSDEGEVKKNRYLCKFHIARAKQSGEEIKEV